MLGIFRRHPFLVAAFAASAALALVFATTFIVSAVYWSAHRYEPVRPWMTVGYIGHSWNLDPRVIDEVAGLRKPQGHPLTLAEIAAKRDVPVDQIIADVEAAIARLAGTQE